MKKLLKIIPPCALLISAPFVSGSYALTISDYPVGAAAGGIIASRHNMGAFGKVIHSNDTTEVCVFCHTPHNANTSVSGGAPIWNRVNSATSYTAYGTTMNGTVISTVGGISLACLSCHDGVTSWDNLINAPGAGVPNPAGADQGWRFIMPGQTLPLVASIDHFDPSATGPCATCHGFFNMPNPAARLTTGTNLTDDHPVSVMYNQALPSLRPVSTVLSQIDLTTGLVGTASAAFSGNLAQNRWAVKGFISDSATILDILRYGRVECTSCHDPHFKNLSWDEVEGMAQGYNDTVTGIWTNFLYCSGETCTDGQFLRRIGGNTGSALCRTCHTK